MGTFDNDLILPGTSTEIISDFDLGYDTNLFGTTDAVAIIVTAFYGPVGTPVAVYNPEDRKTSPLTSIPIQKAR